MSDSNRRITREQFSAGTTIDGDRLDKALGETQLTYNNIPLYGVSSLASKQINWAMTPSMNIPYTENGMGANTGYMYGYWLGGPLESVWDGVRNANQYMDPGATPIQNNITYKGSGKNIFTNPLDQNLTDLTQYKFLWAQTYFTKKPLIIRELSFMCMWDDGFVEEGESYSVMPEDRKWFINDFMDALNVSGFEVYIAVDNNLGLSNTINRDIETRIWGTPAQNFMKVPFGNPTLSPFGITYANWNNPAYTGYGDFGNIPNNFIKLVPAGLHISQRNLEIPIHQNSRIKIALVLPKDTALKWELSNTVTVEDEQGRTPSPFTGMWSASMTVLEELDRE